MSLCARGMELPMNRDVYLRRTPGQVGGGWWVWWVWWVISAVACSKGQPVASPVRVEPRPIPPTNDTRSARPVTGEWFYVSGLPFEVDDGSLGAFFGAHGSVLEARVFRDRDSGRSLGFGCVEIAEPASEVLERLDGANLDGRLIRVDRVHDVESGKVAAGTRTVTSVTSGDRKVRLGERLWLTGPEEIGRVTRIDVGGAAPVIEVSSALGRTRVEAESHELWRPILTSEEAARIETELLNAAPFDVGVTQNAGPSRREGTSNITRLRAYLEGDREQVLTGLATLLDWSVEADRTIDRGAWLGWLHYARDGLLGELAYAMEVPFDVFLERLKRARSSADRRQLRRLGGVATMPAPPSSTLASLSDSEGTQSLGKVTFGREALVASPTWYGRVTQQALRDGTRIPTEPGEWTVWLVTQSETMPDDLAREVATLHGVDEGGLQYTFTSVFRRKWLLLTHASDEPTAPFPRSGATPTYEQLVEADEAARRGRNDTLDEVSLSTRIGGKRVALERLGWTKDQRRAVAVVDAEKVSNTMTSALGAGREAELNLWLWGVSLYRGEWVSPIYAAGPENARTLIAIPARPF